MKNLILLLISLISFSGLSQITINNSDFANGGDTVRMSQAIDEGYDYLSTGPGYNWDFSSLLANSQSLKNFRELSGEPMFIQVVFGTFAPLQYQANYFIEAMNVPVDQLSTFLPVSIEDVFQFTRINNDSLTSIGYSMVVDGNNVPFKSDTIETRYAFPLNYGDTHYSRGYTHVDFNPILDAIWNQYRTRTSEVDGYGIITTPYGTFNALRVKHDITEIDSLYAVWPIIGAGWIPISVPDSHEYEWWTNNEKEPILKITTSEIMGNETVTGIEYRDIYRGLDAGLVELNLQFEVYPNPAANNLLISATENINTIEIFDTEGKRVFLKENCNSNTFSLDVAFLTKGAYKVMAHSEASIGIKSFIKL